jgi:hypothetical protein
MAAEAVVVVKTEVGVVNLGVSRITLYLHI